MKHLIFVNNLKKVFFIALGLLFLSIFPSNLVHAEELTTQKILKVSAYKKAGVYTIQKIDISSGKLVYSDNYTDYKGKYYNGRVVSFGGKTLGNFLAGDFSLNLCSDWINPATRKIEGGCKPMPEGDILIDIPFFPNGKYAEIFDPNGKSVLNVDLTSKAVCNENNICDKPVEDNANCSSDCQVEKGYTMGNGTLENKNNLNQEGEPLTKKNSDWVWPLVKIFLVLITIPIIILIIFWWRKNRS